VPSYNSVQEYPDDYKEACFFSWYSAGHPSVKQSNTAKILRLLPEAPDGRKPNLTTVKRWMVDNDWYSRADDLDAQASLVLEREAVEKRVETLRKLAEYGEKLAAAGMSYIEKNPQPFADNVASAVRAIVSGSEMIFKYAGAADRLAAINQMSDKQIEREILALLGKEQDDDDEIEVESTEIVSTESSEDDDTV
jgi:hypothetical protein